MDKLTKEQRHRCMSAIKGRNTKPELLVRKFLFSRGFRYRLNHSRPPVHPDPVLQCLSMLLGALCTVQTVCLSKLAVAFDSKASRESSFRRIQRFMAQMVLYWTWKPWPDILGHASRSTVHIHSPWTALTGSWESSISMRWC